MIPHTHPFKLTRREILGTAPFMLLFGLFIFILLLPAVLFVLLSMADVARWCSRILHLYFDKDIRVGWSVVYVIAVAIATWLEFGDQIKNHFGKTDGGVCPRCKYQRNLYEKDWTWARFYPWRASEEFKPVDYYDTACVCRTTNCGWEGHVRDLDGLNQQVRGTLVTDSSTESPYRPTD